MKKLSNIITISMKPIPPLRLLLPILAISLLLSQSIIMTTKSEDIPPPFPVEMIPNIRINAVDETITIPSSLEYRFESDSAYTTGGEITLKKHKLPTSYEVSLYVRKKAFSSTPASEDYLVTIPPRAEISGDTDTLMADIFDFENELLCKARSTDYEYLTSSGKWQPLGSYYPGAPSNSYLPITANLNKSGVRATVRIPADYVVDNGITTVINYASEPVKVVGKRERGPSTKDLMLDFSNQYISNITYAALSDNGNFPSSFQFAVKTKNPSYKPWQFAVDGPLLVGESAQGGVNQLIADNVYFFRTAADTVNLKFASKPSSLKIRSIRKAPKIVYDPIKEVFKGLRPDKFVYSISTPSTPDGDWTVYTNESLPLLQPQPAGGETKNLYFKSKPNDKLPVSKSTEAIKVPPRANTPVYSQTKPNPDTFNIYIDFNEEKIIGLDKFSYREKRADDEKQASWKNLSKKGSVQSLRPFLPKRNPVTYEFKVNPTSTTSASLPLEITLNPRLPLATEENISYLYDSNIYRIGDADMLLSTDTKTWVYAPAFSDVPGYANIQVFYKFAPNINVNNPATCYATSSSYNRFVFAKQEEFSDFVFYESKSNTVSGAVGFEHSIDGVNWSLVTQDPFSVLDGLNQFRIPPTQNTPASKPLLLKCKKTPEDN